MYVCMCEARPVGGEVRAEAERAYKRKILDINSTTMSENIETVWI